MSDDAASSASASVRAADLEQALAGGLADGLAGGFAGGLAGGLADGLADGLGDHFPGLEILDRALVLPTGGERAPLRADLVAIDACDRLVLIALVDGRSEGTVLDALDALAVVRESRDLLAAHLRSARIVTTAPMVLVLVAEQFAERVERSLAMVAPLELRLFELCELSSAHGSRAFLVPSRSAVELRRSFELLDRVPASVRPAAELCIARIDRIDTDLVRRSGVDLCSWRYRERRLCSLVWTGERLCGVLDSRDGAWPIGHPAEVEAFVDRAIGEHLRRIEHDEPVSRPDPSAARDPGGDSGFASDPGVLLTPEEIAAFRD